MAVAIEPTEQQLREACGRMARRFGWPDCFETVMQDAQRSRLVRLAVAHPSAAGAVPRRLPRSSLHTHSPSPATGVPLFDGKRAASGERADD